MTKRTADVLIIGAGPSGSIASALLNKQGIDCLVLERQTFPRFSIGESLLAHIIDILDEADMLPAVEAQGFQYKNGAAFRWGDQYTDFDFGEQYTDGCDHAYQVQRAIFDKLLADEAAKQGVDIRYQHEILSFSNDGDKARLQVREPDGSEHRYEGQFVLDASGFGRVLPRLLNLEYPSNFPVRRSVFTHIEDRISDPAFDRQKILVSIHPDHADVWYWLIPFPNGRCSVGVVAERELLAPYGDDNETVLKALIAETPSLQTLLANAKFDTPVQTIIGYSANVKSLHGERYALLGNAGEFLDPVFSSGVTIAMKSAQIASGLLTRQLKNGEKIDWETQYSKPLKRGVNAFRGYVEAWYDGRFRDIIFHPKPEQDIRKMICSMLAGYAWDETNPYGRETDKRLTILAEACRSNPA
ncbi:NAD(P)/FAD-dependent oxidoreductase [Permianibacter aggregans]|uniref:FAD-binding domain-containing protein n=1 Tax=Permianibacter aggregans TaxID=1510150 RepID=A0A4R6UWB2_9GAMM|nr:NAD(P)/FAD-dependent oxidoreductase [Permianibacter aggregans]QGX38763.1 NAD(P)/FAD-dependent oxidoreductase [Permianibacter aggregans]TDQ50566.1 hypothetical protein EV696_102249 [Permianibacter aggregans]